MLQSKLSITFTINNKDTRPDMKIVPQSPTATEEQFRNKMTDRTKTILSIRSHYDTVIFFCAGMTALCN